MLVSSQWKASKQKSKVTEQKAVIFKYHTHTSEKLLCRLNWIYTIIYDINYIFKLPNVWQNHITVRCCVCIFWHLII